MAKNRRMENHTRGSLTIAEKIVAGAARRLLEGDALTAMRSLRAAEQFARMDFRLSTQRRNEVDSRAKLDEMQRQLKARAAGLAQREELIRLGEQQLHAERERLKHTAQTLEALYAQMYAQPPREDGPPPATGDETDPGVAPI